MDCGNPGQALIVCIQGARYRQKPPHKPICGKVIPKGAPEQPFDVVSLAHDKPRATPLNERCPPEEQAVAGAREPEVTLACFA